jgi:hypothetical protein
MGTSNEDEARQIVEAKNNSERQPVLNLQIAKAYQEGTDNGIATRTWQQAIESLTSTKRGENQKRWKTAAKDKAFVPLMPRIIIETPGELLLKVLQSGMPGRWRAKRCRSVLRCCAADWKPNGTASRGAFVASGSRG